MYACIHIYKKKHQSQGKMGLDEQKILQKRNR